MRNILVIAQNTFREAIRDRILYGIVVFGTLYILFTIFLAKLSLGDLVMIRSFGLAGIYLFGLLATIFLGSSIIYKEIERRTLYFILSKPVSRTDVILGKFIGLFGAICFTTLLMTLIYLGVIAYEGGGFDGLGLMAIGFELLEMATFTALLIFLSSIIAPLLATMCAVILVFIGHLLNTLIANTERIGGVTHLVAQGMYYLLPNLEKFNLRNLVVHNFGPGWPETGTVVLYAALYVGLLLYAAVLCFERREF